MNVEMVISIGRDTVTTLILMGGPMLLTGAVIGIVVSMLQQVTQLRDQSLTFIPKILGVLVVALIGAPFLIKTIVTFSEKVFYLAQKLGQGM